MGRKINDVGGRIRKQRELLGISQTKLASIAGLTPAAISQFESGAREPSALSLAKLVTPLEISADYILGVKELNKEKEIYSSERLKGMMKDIMSFSPRERGLIYSYFDYIKYRKENRNE